jgi:hypothetical protein
MAKLGTISLQALESTDVFLEADVYLDGITEAGEISATITEPGFDMDKAWVSGNVPKVIPVDVSGVSSVIYGWYKGSSHPGPFKLKVYVQYEEVEELITEEIK